MQNFVENWYNNDNRTPKVFKDMDIDFKKGFKKYLVINKEN